jgi:hypothetical protein
LFLFRRKMFAHTSETGSGSSASFLQIRRKVHKWAKRVQLVLFTTGTVANPKPLSHWLHWPGTLGMPSIPVISRSTDVKMLFCSARMGKRGAKHFLYRWKTFCRG